MSELTNRALAASLKKLLNQKPIDKITVKDIAEDCGVNRHTFYYHFQDIYDLIEWLCIDEATRVLGAHKTYSTWKEGFLDLIDYLQDNKLIIMNIYNSNYRNYLGNYIKSLARPFIGDFLKNQSEGMKISEENFEFIVDTYTLGIVDFAMEWIATDMTERYNDSTKLFLRLLDGSMKYTLQKFSEQ